MEPDERSMRDRIEAARVSMRLAFSEEWKRRVALHLALFPAGSLNLQLHRDRIAIDARLLPGD